MPNKLLSYLQSLLDEELPFLALKKAGQNQVQVISQKNQNLHKSAHDNLSYGVFSEFQNINNQVYIISEEELSFTWYGEDVKASTDIASITEEGKKEYLKLFEKGMKELQKGHLKKVVLSRKQEFPKSDSDVEIFERLLDCYPTANGYFFYHPKVGTWTGATPELLLEVSIKDNDQSTAINDSLPAKVQTMSLAGTAVNNGNDIHIWGEKEKEEQRLVTDDIIAKFQSAGVTSIQESELETVQAGHLLHLRTILEGISPTENIESLLNQLHPTPAVCGLPRDRAMQFILENENYDRSYYTGYLGVVNKNSRNYYVNLRCMQLLKETALIYVGGGVTSKSDGELEYQETMAKLNTMYKLL